MALIFNECLQDFPKKPFYLRRSYVLFKRKRPIRANVICNETISKFISEVITKTNSFSNLLLAV